MQIPKIDIEATLRLCFACGQENPIGLKLKPVHDGEKVTAEFVAGKFYQGWGNVIHGGILYTLLDEVTAYAMLCHGVELGVTARSEIKFRRTAPIGEPIQASAWVTKSTKRLVETKGVVTLMTDNTVIADGDFLFYVLRRSRKTILWDMDGVISDSYSYHLAAWQETFKKRGVDFAEQDFSRLFGTRNDFIVRTVMGNNLAEHDVKTIVQEKEETFRRKAGGKIKSFPGAIRLLAALRQANVKQGLASSAPKANIDLVLSELNLAEVFDAVVSGQDVSESKPSPQIYLAAAQRLGAAPEDCLVIEDSPLGIQAANAAGMKSLAVTNTHCRQKLGEATKVVDSLDGVDLITLLMRV